LGRDETLKMKFITSFISFLGFTPRSEGKALEEVGIDWLERLINDCTSKTNIKIPIIPKQFYKEITDINCKYVRGFLKNYPKEEQEAAIKESSTETAKCMIHIFQGLNSGYSIDSITHEMYMRDFSDEEHSYNLDPKLIRLMGKFNLF